MVDYILTISAAIITASVIILGSFLLRYRQLVKEANSSTRLAKDVWDSVNSRFSVTDGRLIDLMAKTEVLYSRAGSPKPTSHTPSQPPSQTSQLSSRAPISTSPPPPTVSGPTTAPPKPEIQAEAVEGTETERKILQFLAEGPKTSAQIVGQVALTREHTGRLLKSLFGRGLVTRNEHNKPYVYELTEAGRTYVAS